jgi:hypothetical protein
MFPLNSTREQVERARILIADATPMGAQLLAFHLRGFNHSRFVKLYLYLLQTSVSVSVMPPRQQSKMLLGWRDR